MSRAGDPAKLLSDAAAAARSSEEQPGLELEPEAKAIAEAAGELDEQLDKAGLADAEEILAVQRELDCDMYAAVREHRRRQGKGGRKKGSLNKRNQEFRALVLASGGHPGLFLQRVHDRPVELLAAELGCTKEKAAQIQVRCASELLPYIEGKMPATVNLAVRGDMSLNIAQGVGLFDDLDDVHDAEFEEMPELSFSEENQPVSNPDSEASD